MNLSVKPPVQILLNNAQNITIQKLAEASNEDARMSYEQVLHILSDMNAGRSSYYEGTLTRFIIDSYSGDLNLGSLLIELDEKYAL